MSSYEKFSKEGLEMYIRNGSVYMEINGNTWEWRNVGLSYVPTWKDKLRALWSLFLQRIAFLRRPALIILLLLVYYETPVTKFIDPAEPMRAMERFVYATHSDLCMDNVEFWADRVGVKFVGVFIAQVRLESSNLTSRLVSNNKNLIGMKYPKVRETTAIGEEGGYAVYRDWIDCIKDYRLWQQIHSPAIAKCQSPSEYLDFLSVSGYSENQSYQTLLNKFVRGGSK